MIEFRPAEEHLRELLDAEKIEMGVVISNPHLDDNPLIYVNEKFLSESGYSAEEVVGRNCRFLQGPGTCPEATQAIGRAIGARKEVDILNYRKDGSTFMNRVRIRPLFDENSDLMYFLGVQHPVVP